MTSDALDVDREFWTTRLNGYLDALSIVNGRFREFRYSAYLKSFCGHVCQENVTEFYTPDCRVEFGTLEVVSPWLGWLENTLAESLVSEPFGNALDMAKDGDRVYQIAWYVLDMMRFITNDFESEEMFKCDIRTITKENESEGILYIIPIEGESFEGEYLVLNLQRINANRGKDN